MSKLYGNSIDEQIDNDFVGHQHTNGLGDQEEFHEQPEQKGFDFSFLKTPTGDGEIDDYLTHPLNPKKSRALGQVLRGLTGFLGNMSYAIVDITIGILNFQQERTVANVDSRGDIRTP